MAAQHDLILGRSWDQNIKQSDMINVRHYICVKMYGSVTVITDRSQGWMKVRLLGQPKPVTSYPMWCHW